MNKMFEYFKNKMFAISKIIFKILLVLIILTTIVTCIDSSNKKEINILSSSESKEIQLGSIYKVIPLESTEDSKLAYINKSVVDFKNDRIFILSLMNLYIYDTNGKFLKKASLGRGPLEFIRIMSFTIDTYEKKIYILNDPRNITILSYDLELICSYEYDGFHCSDIQLINNNNLLLYNYATHKEGQGYFVGIYNLEQRRILKKLVPISESPYHRFTIITLNNFPKYGNRQFFSSPNIFGLYEFIQDSLVRIRDYSLGNKTVPESFSKKFLKNKRRRIFREESIENGYIPFIINTFEFKDNYLVILDDPENNCVVIPENDISSIFMNGPIYEYFSLPSVQSLKIPVGIYEDKMVFSLSPNEFFTNKDMNTLKEISIGEQKLTVTYDSNPVLIVIK